MEAVSRQKNWVILGTILVFIFGVISYVWQDAALAIESATVIDLSLQPEKAARYKIPRQTVKGIYVTAYSAGTKAKMDSLIKLIDETELNAVVIDIKDYSGKILFDSQHPIAVEKKLKYNQLGDVRTLIKRLHEHNIYVIARQTVFQDPLLAKAKTNWAIQSKSGGLWRDDKGLAWVDPTREEVWQYNVEIAKEAIALGFDEINFDYVRFPSDGNMSNVVYTTKDKKKYQVMESFFKYLSDNLKDEPAWISVDVFGLVMEAKGTNDMAIGQRLVDAVDNVDYICPMMYPSHYPSGYIGLDNPAQYPAKVFENGLKKGRPWFKDKRAEVRPWIQAFNIGAVYGAEKIRAQIDTVEKYTDAGWLMWNAANRYSQAGLKTE